MAQQNVVSANDLTYNAAMAKRVESHFARWVTANAVNTKFAEYKEQTEGRVIDKLNDAVLKDNPANALYSYTMNNFSKAYSQTKRASSNYTDCSAFVSGGMRTMISEMMNVKHGNGQNVFNTSDLQKVNSVFAAGSTTSSQEQGLQQIYRSYGAKPQTYTGAKVRDAIMNETEVGKVLIMDKDARSSTTTDRHIWVSVRDTKTNKIAWAESTIGTGVIISSPEELLQRNRALTTSAGRLYNLYDPFIGQNRKELNEFDKQSMALTVAYHANKKEMESTVQVSGNSNKNTDINYYPNFTEMQKRLMNDKHNIENLNIEELKNDNRNTRTFSL